MGYFGNPALGQKGTNPALGYQNNPNWVVFNPAVFRVYVWNYLFIYFSLLERRGEYFVNLSAAICLVGVGLHCAFKIEFIDKVFD